MLGKLGLRIFLLGLFATIILYHFFAKLWMLSWVPMLCIGALGVGFVLWFVFSIEWIILWFQKRSSQFGLSVIFSTIAVIAVLSVINWASVKKNKKWDLTRSSIHSLSDQSINVLHSLPEEITLEVWTFNLKEMSGTHDMGRFLDNYVQHSKGKVKLLVRNPNAERIEAIQAKVTRKDVIIAKSASGRESRIENFNSSNAEEQITSAIVQAIKGSKKNLCLITGHGELETQNMGQGNPSISEWKEALEGSAYAIKEITLATEKVYPSGCEMIASIGPKSAPSDHEVKLIQEYLANGGKLLALWGIETPQAWQKIIDPYGVKLENNILIDERVQGAPAVYTKNFSFESDITRSFSTPILFLMARSISLPAKAPEGVSIKKIASVENGTLMKEGDLKSLQGAAITRSSLKSANEKVIAAEIKMTIASTEKTESAAGEEGEEKKAAPKEATIIIMGNHMVASNGLVGQFGNMDFLLNTVSYLMKDNDLIGIRPKDLQTAKLELTAARLREVQGYLLLSTLMFLVFAFMAAFGRKTILDEENMGEAKTA